MANYSVIDTVRWKAVRFQHKLTDDMEVAKILLDCYDVIISGCLQWKNNQKRNKLPTNSSQNGWDLLDDIVSLMKMSGTEENWKLLMWSDEINDQDQDDISRTEDIDLNLGHNKKVSLGKKEESRNQKDSKYQKGELGHQDESRNLKRKHISKTINENETKTDYDNEVVDISLVKCENGYPDDMNIEDNTGIINDEPDVENDESDDETGEDLDKGDIDWIPEKSKHDSSKRNPILLKRRKCKDYYPESVKNDRIVAKVKRKCTRSVEFLTVPNVTKIIECKICVHTVGSVDEFRKHFASEHSETADGKKGTKTDIMQLKSIPKLAHIYTPCPDCNELVPPVRLETHRIRNHFQRTCELCGVFFTTFSGWNRHLRVHKAKETGSNPYQCEICGKKFPVPGPLTEHRKRHISYRSHICEVCGKGFKVKYELKKHIMRSHGDNFLTCEFCGKTFRCKFNLKTHLRVHTHERPYLCSLCGKSYSHNSSLKAHSKTEHGIELAAQCQRLEEVEALDLPSRSGSHNSSLKSPDKSQNGIELRNQYLGLQKVEGQPSVCEPESIDQDSLQNHIEISL